LKEQNKLADDLALSEKSLAAIQTTQLSQQLENLKARLDESEAQLKESQTRLRQTVVSVDVTEEFFKVAEYCSVNVTALSTTIIAQAKYEGVTCSTISITPASSVKIHIVNFIIGLNNDYTTGNVQSAQITIAPKTEDDETGEAASTASVNMIIYSYEGK
jgi:hypothetical protein